MKETSLLKRIKVKNKKIKAGGGVVYRRIKEEVQVLLIFRNGIWDIPKGKLEKGESISECASREVMEEVHASELPEILNELVATEHSYEEKGKYILKTTWWYTMRFNSAQSFTPQKKEGITEVKWTEIDKAIEIVGFDNLKQVLLDFKEKNLRE